MKETYEFAVTHPRGSLLWVQVIIGSSVRMSRVVHIELLPVRREFPPDCYYSCYGFAAETALSLRCMSANPKP